MKSLNESLVKSLSDTLQRSPDVADIGYYNSIDAVAGWFGIRHDDLDAAASSAFKLNSTKDDPPPPVSEPTSKTTGLPYWTTVAVLDENGKAKRKNGKIVFQNVLVDPSKADSVAVNPTGNAPALEDAKCAEALRGVIGGVREQIMSIIDMTRGFVTRAKNLGFNSPSNPFVVISQMDPDTVKEQSEDYLKSLVNDVNFYLGVLKAEQEGTIDLEEAAKNGTQLSSITLSLDGYGGSGNTVLDLSQFIPNMDALTKKRAEAALASLDFKRRVPKMLFTCNYAPDGELKASIVGWKKMTDTSGYIVRRRSLFTGQEILYTLTNDELDNHDKNFGQYVDQWVLSFYNSHERSNVRFFLDGNIRRNEFYIYTVVGYQTYNAEVESLFAVPIAVLPSEALTKSPRSSQTGSVVKQLKDKPSNPWPIISLNILGSMDNDWVLAGTNIKASSKRQDVIEQVRKYSYLSARIEDLNKFCEGGMLVKPQDVNDIIKNITNSLSKFGSTNTIKSLMRDTGMLYYFDGIDAAPDERFRSVNDVDSSTSNLIAHVAAAIDPETMTLDLRTLASNMPELLKGNSAVTTGKELSAGISPSGASKPETIAVSGSISDNKAYGDNRDEAQFLASLNEIGKAYSADMIADLTKFEGISMLMRAIRIMSDFGQGKQISGA